MAYDSWFGTLDLKVGFAAGAICGIVKMFAIYLLTDVYSIVLLKVLITGIVGGIGGVIGKHFIVYAWGNIKKRLNKNKNKPS